MKKLAALLALVALVVVAMLPALAWADRGGRGHGFKGHGGHGFKGHGHRHFHSRPVGSRVFIGLGFGYPYYYGYYPYYRYPYYRYPYYAYPPAYYYTPPPVVVQEPPVYVQQQPAPAPSPQAELYWYYCPNSRAYYPHVQSCSEPWVKVPPRAQ